MKWIKRGAIALVILVIAAVLGLFFFIDPLVKGGVETAGSHALGVDTTLGGARLGLLSGDVALSELKVANPDGFQTPHFLALGKGEVEVSLGSLLSDKVVVPRILLAGIDLNIEEKSGKANVSAILDNLKKLSGPGEDEPEKPEPEPETKEGKRFVIETLTISDVNVHTQWAGKKVEVTIEEIPLTGIGAGGSGVPLAQVSGIVVQAIVDAVVKNAGGAIPEALMGELKSGLAAVGNLGNYTTGAVKAATAAAEEALEEGAKAVEAASKEAAAKVTEGVEKAKKEAEEAAEKLKKGVGNILGGKE